MAVVETNVAQLRAHLAEALEQVRGGAVVVVRSQDKPGVALVDEELLEDVLAAQNPRLIKKINQARAEKDVYSFEEVFSDLA